MTAIAVGGTIGQSGSPTTITAKNGIGTVVAQSIYAHIIANSGGAGAVRRVKTQSGGTFSGSLTASQLAGTPGTDGVLVPNGTLDANIWFKTSGAVTPDAYLPIEAASTGANRTIRVDGSLVDDATHDGRITITGASAS